MSSSSSIIVLRSSDGKTFEVDEVVALESETIRDMIEDGSADIDNIRLPYITNKILSKVIDYCKKQTDDNVDKEELKAFEAEFVKVDSATIEDIILAAYYLKVIKLQDLAIQAVVDIIKRMTPEQIRKALEKHRDDFTPGAEEEVCRENEWAFD